MRIDAQDIVSTEAETSAVSGNRIDEADIVDLDSPESTNDVPQWAARYPQTFRMFHKTVTSGIEAVGLVGGGIAGAPFALQTLGTSSVGGAALGYAMARNVNRQLNTMLGVGEQSGSLKDESIAALEDVKTGAMIEMGGRLVGPAADKTAKGVLRGVNALSPKTAKWFGGTPTVANKETEELLKLYKQYGVKPLPSEVAGRLQRTLSMVETGLGYSPASSDVLYNNSVMRLAHMNAMRDRLITTNGSPKQIEMIGRDIRQQARKIMETHGSAKGEKLDAMVNAFMGQVGRQSRYGAGLKFSEILSSDREGRQEVITGLYAKVKQSLPDKGQDVVPISDDTIAAVRDLLRVEKAKSATLKDSSIINLLEDYLPKKMPSDIQKLADTPGLLQKNPELKAVVDSYNPRKTWEGLDGDRSILLAKVRAIWAEARRETPHARIYDLLQQRLESDMAGYAEKVGGEVWTTYNGARGAAREMHTLYDKDVLKIMNKAPEDIVTSIISGKSSIAQLKKIKAAVGDAGLHPIRQSFFKQTLEKVTNNNKQTLNPMQLKKILNQMDEMLDDLATPEQKQMLMNIADKGIYFNERQAGMKTIQFLKTISGTSNEAVVNFLVKPRNTYNIRMAKRLLPPERVADLQEGALQKVFKMTARGDVLPAKTHAEFRALEHPLKELLPDKTFEEVKKFIVSGANAARVEALAINASQTGQVIIGHGALQTLKFQPSRLVYTLGADYLLAKMYMSKPALRLITESVKLSPESPKAIELFVKALAITSEENAEEFRKKIEPGHGVPPHIASEGR